jgi:Holliday junction resolvasome RuvABC endonuclease subunit
MSPSKKLGLVLAIHATSRGFGWVLFEGPMAIANWGIATAKDDYGIWCMKRFQRLVDQYRPLSVVLEKTKMKESTRASRANLLMQDMRGFADNRDLDVSVYTQEEIASALLANKKATRHEVADAAANMLPILRHRLPSARKPWETEDGRRCLFDAAALGLTHYVVTRGTL